MDINKVEAIQGAKIKVKKEGTEQLYNEGTLGGGTSSKLLCEDPTSEYLIADHIIGKSIKN